MEQNKKKLVKKIIDILEKEFPDAKIRLNHSTPFELLVATILSAQCTDERVNIVTSELFKKYKTPSDFAKLEPSELENLIYSTGYYKSKARHIIQSAHLILNKYHGKVPDTMEELLNLPGVGRKTANVILSHAFDKPGIVVDTHVTRITNRLGLVSTKDSVKIEFQLIDLVPKSKWVIFTHLLISHGRKYCKSRKPKCEICPINSLCGFFLKNM
ncbi:endonuclease III [Bacteroidetes/Chlorobi group bacterium Naka2016]|jgi:endonuclease-3|nr:MAG: endonuclease III [Bacteroidetes/Chlorobi group bacterium Naka2016]